MWAGSVLIALPVATSRPWKAIPLAHVEALSGAAAFGTVFAELFMIKSLLVFDPQPWPGKAKADDQSDVEPPSPMWNRNRVWLVIRISCRASGIFSVITFHQQPCWAQKQGLAVLMPGTLLICMQACTRNCLIAPPRINGILQYPTRLPLH